MLTAETRSAQRESRFLLPSPWSLNWLFTLAFEFCLLILRVLCVSAVFIKYFSISDEI